MNFHELKTCVILFVLSPLFLGFVFSGCTQVVTLGSQSANSSQGGGQCSQGKKREEFKAPESWQEIKRVFIVMLENTDAKVAATLPYLSSLARNGGSFTHFSALTHPSQPNY